jgi:hypothetical protein
MAWAAWLGAGGRTWRQKARQQTLDLAPVVPSAAAASKPASSESDLVHAVTLERLDARSVGVE